MVFSLAAALFVDFWKAQVIDSRVILGYVYVLVFGSIFLGLASPVAMSLIPEPLMQPAPVPHVPLGRRLLAPVRDGNFRRLLTFLGLWGFASNLAIPFFAVYMLVRLQFPLAWVIGFSVLSQGFNILFLRVWGRYVDRFGTKAVLSLCVSLYLLVIIGWVFTTMPEQYFLTIPLLFLLHIFMGIAAAGVNITVGTIGLKLAPQGESTSYLAGASLVVNVGAGIGPLFGGYLADFFMNRQLTLTLSWMQPGASVSVPALSIIGYDFLFVIAFVYGLITLAVLATVKEEGEVSRETVLESLVYPARDLSRPASMVPQYNLVSTSTLGYIRRIPIPGLDAVLGVTAYQIAEAARAATAAAIRGRRFTRQLAGSLERRLARLWGNKPVLDKSTVEITREVSRGAMHAADDGPVTVEDLVETVASGTVEASLHAGGDPIESFQGASQGILQGAAEAGLDLTEAAARTLDTARDLAAEAGVPVEEAVISAAEGTLQAAEEMGPEAVAEVVDALPESLLEELADKARPGG